LFGGAITAHIPANFEDASNHRPVPDTQEVFISRTYDTDISIIFDILERVPGSDQDALELHWDEVVASDPQRSHKLFNTQSVVLPNLVDKPVYTITGTISEKDPQTQPPLFIALLMTVVRLQEQTTDLVITVNVPFTSVGLVAGEGLLAAPGWEGELSGVPSELLQAGMMVRDKVLETFRICDWGLF
ncbi:hypothetical protein BDD12DRAFT_690462, partial [Trichophaea hybrida]